MSVEDATQGGDVEADGGATKDGGDATTAQLRRERASQRKPLSLRMA